MPRFTLDDAALARLFALWSVPLPVEDVVLFAVRGAVPVEEPSGKAGWTERATLVLTPPDHIHMRCTIGIWDRRARRLFVARGSTVPHRDHVLKAAARKGGMKGRGTNQLEPGYYTDLTKGEHLQGKPQGHAALRQTGFRFYRRAHLGGQPVSPVGTAADGDPKGRPPAAPLYTDRDPLYFGNPYDNLHCAWNADPDAPGFRSAGCLVVAGWPHSPRLADARPNSGAWKTFHDLLYAAPQQSFPLLLLPAAEVEAALNARGGKGRPPGSGVRADHAGPPRTPDTRRLVYGSRGEAVKALQRDLAAQGAYTGRITGHLGASTYRAWKQRPPAA